MRGMLDWGGDLERSWCRVGDLSCTVNRSGSDFQHSMHDQPGTHDVQHIQALDTEFKRHGRSTLFCAECDHTVVRQRMQQGIQASLLVQYLATASLDTRPFA